MLYSAYVKFKYHTKAEASTKGFKIHINSYFKQGYVDDYKVPSWNAKGGYAKLVDKIFIAK